MLEGKKEGFRGLWKIKEDIVTTNRMSLNGGVKIRRVSLTFFSPEFICNELNDASLLYKIDRQIARYFSSNVFDDRLKSDILYTPIYFRHSGLITITYV